MNEPGFRFKEGKLYAFSEETVMILEAWPALKALRKGIASSWQEFDPRFRVVQPYRPRKPKKTPQLELGLGVVQVKSSISEQRRRAFDGFRFTMPKPVAAATEKFQSRQWGLLKLMQKSEAALELAGINPVLCFALANYRPFRGRSTTIEGAAIVCRRRQREIADWLGFPGTEAVAKIISKMSPESASVELLVPMRRAIRDERILKIFSHLPNLNAGVVALALGDGLLEATTPAFIAEVAESPAEKYRAVAVDMLVDTLVMLQAIDPQAGTPKIQSLARLRAMHSEVSTKFLSKRPPGSGEPRLPHPPLRGTKNIVPILTVEDLVQEGMEQDNCVATYLERVRKRTTFVYRVLRPERATLSIVRGNDGDWQISELESRSNRNVSPITRIEVESWVNQYALSV